MISFVFPVYNEQDNLKDLYERLNAVAKNSDEKDWEFIFVDDSSADKSPDILKELHAKDSRVKVIRFSRNCGGHAAIHAGLEIAQGDAVAVMASDLQDPPELIHDLMKEWTAGGKLVWAIRTDREGESFSTKFFSKLYYSLVNILTNVTMPPLGTDVFLADRSVIEAYKTVREKHSSIYMVFAWLGFDQRQVKYVKEARSGW